MENKMGHFVNWKFGVPVRIYEHNPGGYNYPEYEEARLVDEEDRLFTIVFNNGSVGTRLKRNFYYELIPHEYSTFSPRFPVCQTPGYTTFCNGGGIMAALDSTRGVLRPYPTATFTIDGKTIELSAETTAELKKKLGI